MLRYLEGAYKSEKDPKLLRISNPTPSAWANSLLLWFYLIFIGVGYHISSGKFDLRVLGALITAVYFCGSYFMNREYFLTQSEIIERKFFPFSGTKRKKISDIKSTGLIFLWHVRVEFIDGTVMRLPSISIRKPIAGNIPPDERQLYLDCGNTLAFELMRRKNKPASLDDVILPKKCFNFFHFISPAILSISALVYWLNTETDLRYAKLNFNNEKEISFYQLQYVFTFHKGQKFADLKSKYLIRCENNKDYTCRLAGNFLKLENREIEAIPLYKIACLDGDIAGCGNLYRSRLSTADDREPASLAIKKYCINENRDKKIASHCLEYAKWAENIKAGKFAE